MVVGLTVCCISNDVICILKPVDRKITLPRVITLPCFLLHTCISVTYINRLDFRGCLAMFNYTDTDTENSLCCIILVYSRFYYKAL